MVEALAPLGLEQVGDDADDARSIEDVQRRLRVREGDLHGRVLAGGRGAPDQQREVEAAPLISSATCTISSSDGVISPES